MDGYELLIVFMVVGVPVLGGTLALVTRFALKPMVESIIQLRQTFQETPVAGALSRAEAEGLREDIDALQEQMRRLSEAVEFDRKLLDSPGDASPNPLP